MPVVPMEAEIESRHHDLVALGGAGAEVIDMQLKCGCVYDRGKWIKFCREHGLKLLKQRAERLRKNSVPMPKRRCDEKMSDM